MNMCYLYSFLACCCFDDGTVTPDFRRWDVEKSANNCLPVGVSVHNTCSPFLSVIDQLDGSLQGLSGFVDDAVSNLETTDESIMKNHCSARFEKHWCTGSADMHRLSLHFFPTGNHGADHLKFARTRNGT